MASSHKPSSLLSTLEKVNDIAWATLVPKLQANGSAGSFALVCTHLRQLCHGAQTKLRLAGSDCSDERAIAQISLHFPSCTEVALDLGTREDACFHLPVLLPALARLQRLSKLDLRMAEGASQASVVALVLGPVRLLLPCLRCLELSVSASWADDSLPWQALGRATQLTTLKVAFEQQVDNAATLEHLSALSRLSSLSSLTVDAESMLNLQQYSWLQHLTSLTQLSVPLVKQHQDLVSIGSCTNLQTLAFFVFGHPDVSEAECAAIAQLVQLTSLGIRTDTGSNPHFLSALGALSQLELLSVDGLSPASLPCLAGLSKLTQLYGTWQAGGSSSSGTPVVCSNVTRLTGDGPVPFASFPLLRGCHQWAIWDPANLTALAKNCKQLERFGLQEFTGPSLSSDCPVREHTAAIQALASLQHLTALSFGVNDDAEVAAVAAIKQLRAICVVVPTGSSCTAAGLQLLQQLRCLRRLTLELHGLHPSQPEALSVLCGMQQLEHLSVFAGSEWLHVFRAALQAAQAAGLAVPEEVVIAAHRQ